MSDELEDEEGVDLAQPPWRSFLPKSLPERPRDAVAAAPDEVREAVETTIATRSASPEDGSSLDRWLEWVAALPWDTTPGCDPLNMEDAAGILSAAHRGDDDVKESLLDRIFGSWLLSGAGSGHRLRPLLLVGPPGTGKSSLARAVVKAIRRPCSFISVPTAVEDRVYLTGCSRAYSNGEPGAIVKAVRAFGRRVVIVLDEIDKAGHGPAFDAPSATASLLELLDGSGQWTDRYLAVAYDLSEVLYLATANSVETIPTPLLDRCDVVEIPGPALQERLDAARFHLWPRLVESFGSIESLIPLDDDALHCIVAEHAERDEAGLRGVESRLEACLLRAARRGFAGIWPVPVTQELIRETLAPLGRRSASRPLGFATYAGPEPRERRDRPPPGPRLSGGGD
ncbi:MAG: AAA family ATPase [Candidatus Dormibacteria bacterium]